MICTSQTSSGKQCRANAIDGSEKCFFHSAGKEEERRAARKKGGKSTVARFVGIVHLPDDTPDFALDTADDARMLLGKVANYVLRGQVAPTIGNCVAYLVATSIRTKEAGEFEQRLAAIETRLKELMT